MHSVWGMIDVLSNQGGHVFVSLEGRLLVKGMEGGGSTPT